MTKDEFYEEITDFDELIEFCNRYGCYYIVEDLRRSEDFDEWVWDQLEELRRRWYWYDLRSALNSLDAPSGGYFVPRGGLDYIDLSAHDLDEYLDEVVTWGDQENLWDPEDEEDNDWPLEEDFGIENEEEPAFESEIELTMLIGVA